MLLVLLAALLHASWNAWIRGGGDKLLDTTSMAVAAGVLAAAMLPFVGVPLAPSWPYLAGSVAVHFAYFSLLAAAYRHGEMSYAYPLMRGSAPLLTAIAAGGLIGEPLTAGGWIGIALLSLGILALTGDSLRGGRFHLGSAAFALGNAATIVAYTLIDGVGVRKSGSALSYILWLTFLNAFPLALFSLLRAPHKLATSLRTRWRMALIAAVCSMASYGIALWAMGRAPIALVAALRETSVIFGTVIAAVFLKERFGATRYTAAAMVTAGAVAMKIW